MTQEKLQYLADIYNQLLGISTKGQDSFIMVDCLHKLLNFILISEQELTKAKKEEKLNEQETVSTNNRGDNTSLL